MPVSIRKYTELKLSISDYLQRRNWARLFELCGTSDEETAKTIAVIMSFYSPRKIWSFLDYVFSLSAEERRGKRDAVGTVCYILGKIGQTSTERSLNYLRRFLLEDHMLRWQVTAAVSNLWVLDTKTTSKIILNKWVLRNEDNDDLTDVGIRSSEYLAKNAPERVSPFLHKIAAMSEERKSASKTARELIQLNDVSGRKVASRLQKKK